VRAGLRREHPPQRRTQMPRRGSRPLSAEVPGYASAGASAEAGVPSFQGSATG
jgi:hypothetical protein